MSFLSCEEMLAAARSQKITLAEAVLRSDLEESRLTEEQSRAAMHHLWQVMQATSWEYDPAQRSRSGLSGGDAAKVEQAHKEAHRNACVCSMVRYFTLYSFFGLCPLLCFPA